MADLRIQWKILWVAMGAAALAVAVYLLAGLPLRQARESWRDGRRHEAIVALERWSRGGVRRAEYDETLAVVHLTAGRRDKAREYLRRMAVRRPEWFPPISKEEAARALVSNGQYAEFLEYDAAAHHRRESDEVALYRAAAQLGVGRPGEAERIFEAIGSDSVDPKRYAALRRAISQWREGSVPFVLDRNGATVAALQIASGDLVSLNVDFEPLVDREGGTLTFEQHLKDLGTPNAVATTLDPFVQHAAVTALGAFRGSLVAIDPATGEILAVASSRGEGAVRNLAFEQDYEPGSIVKVLTAIAAARSGVNLDKFFPLQCGGFTVIDGRQFFDWAMHGTVPDLKDAMANSCNVAFANIGLAVGQARLMEMLKDAGFGSTVDLGFATVPLGKITRAPATGFDTANAAIGLQHETVNALHLAMIGAAVANGGTMATPRLIRERRSILGDALPVRLSVRRTSLAGAASVKPVLEAMKAAVTSQMGTGRRAAVPGLSIALKTGTAGDSSRGFDALIVALAPAEHPRIAIGMIAENSGPAEFAGAKITQDFFQQMAQRLK